MNDKKSFPLDNLTRLSGFEVDTKEHNRLEKELAEFLKYAEILNEANVENVEPMQHAVAKSNFMRSDDVQNFAASSLWNNAPAMKESSYLVPPQQSHSAHEAKEYSSSQEDDLEVVIGLEVHAQLKTKSKLFCACPADFGQTSNHNTCPVCTGQPGALPVLNEEAVKMTILAGLALRCEIQHQSIFARKNYFYPDSPKAYQISQFEMPICLGGHLTIDAGHGHKKVRLTRIHMEEDAGKMVHVGAPGIWGSKASAVDYNRSSIPLIEIVSEPDISSPKEAKEYVMMLRATLVSLGICDGNLEQGSMRCDANVSLRPRGTGTLGVKTEIKNMNSFKAIERALEYEIERQRKLIRQGEVIQQQTRLWDESKQKTYLMRTKEDSHDYRYFPDPDLLPLKLLGEWVSCLSRQIPPSPLERKEQYLTEYKLSEEEAFLFLQNPSYSNYFEDVVKIYAKPREVANWFFTELLSYSPNFADFAITAQDFAAFLTKIDEKVISGKMGKGILQKAIQEKISLLEVIKKDNLQQITNRDEIAKIVQTVVDNHPKQVEEYKGGKTKVFAFFVGKVMAETKGKANPQIVNEVLKEIL